MWSLLQYSVMLFVLMLQLSVHISRFLTKSNVTPQFVYRKGLLFEQWFFIFRCNVKCDSNRGPIVLFCYRSPVWMWLPTHPNTPTHQLRHWSILFSHCRLKPINIGISNNNPPWPRRNTISRTGYGPEVLRFYLSGGHFCSLQ